MFPLVIAYFLCFTLDVSVGSLWNCGDSLAAQEYIANDYENIATKIRDYFLTGLGKGSALKELTDIENRFGPRTVGSKNLEDAIDFIVDKYKSDFKIHTEQFQTFKWERKYESATLLSPIRRSMSILGLGSSVPTPAGGITANAVVVRSFQELENLGDRVRGKIVVFNQPWINYDTSKAYRSGAAKAAVYGAVATLIRSVTPFSIYSPHTGMQYYKDGIQKIPTAAITVEDAKMLDSLQTRNEDGIQDQSDIRIHLEIESEITDTNVTLRNVVIDFPGVSNPNEVVLTGAHIDSWDVGTGAIDDLSGVVVNLAALRALRDLGLKPRRTIRVVLFNDEEQGYVGSKAYYQKNKDNHTVSHVFAMEADMGGFKPTGLNFTAPNETAIATMRSIMRLLEPIEATNVTHARYTGDGGEFAEFEGVPGAWLLVQSQQSKQTS